MNYKLWLAAVLWLIVQNMAAQQYRVAYFGETITHYGARVGWENTLAANDRVRSNGSIRHELLFSINLSVFRHPNNHIGVALSPELGWRRTAQGGGIVQAAISAGLFRSFYEGKTYRTTPEGQLKRTPLAGQWGFMPGFSLGVGRDLSVKGNLPLLVFANAHGLVQYPYNKTILLRPALEVGVIFKTKS